MSSATNPIAATPAAAAAALSRVSSAELKLVSAGDDDRNVPVDTPAVHRHHSAQPEGFSWFSRTGFTNQFTKNKMLDEMITPLVYSAPYRIVYWWDPLLNAFTGRAGDIAVETLTFVAIVAYGYYNQLLSDKAAGVYTHCSGVSLADDGAVASKTTLNVTACMECAGAVDNIVYATLDPKALCKPTCLSLCLLCHTRPLGLLLHRPSSSSSSSFPARSVLCFLLFSLS
eukprot:SAG31_NODE_4581_length_3120_cov_2.891096_4_plen_228_part_00